nr:hypothetical protein [Tanacetum cinerariifolium]
MSIDDLYNNFKIIEQDVKKSVGASISAQNMAFMTAPSNSSTNDVNTANPAYEASTISLNVNTASPQDLEQNHEDDLEAMDLRWQLSLLSMRAKRECKAQRNQDGQFRNQDNTRKQENNEDTSSKAKLVIDGVGFDWSDMAEEHVQTNMALMAFSDSEETASLSTSENGEIVIIATIDGSVKSVTEASIRRHLKLEDSEGISSLPNTKIFKKLALIGVIQQSYHYQFYHLQGYLHYFMIHLSQEKMESLESDLKQIKLTYGAAYTKIIMKVKKLENKVKSRKACWE